MWRFQPSRFRDWFNTDKPSADLTMCLNNALKFTFYLTTVIAFTFQVNQVEGIRWINTPSDITMCAHETANLTWEYVKEEHEDIRQIQWRFNSSTLFAYRGVTNGLYIDPKYHGRVEESGVTGILLKNITANDIGSYSFRIIVTWKETTVIQSMWLNVIEADAVTIPKWCTCDRFPVFQEWNGGRNINVESDGCRLKVNSSHCCIKEPVNRCKDNNSHDLCLPLQKSTNGIKNVTPVRNINQITENDTQNRLVPEGPTHKDTENNTTIYFMMITMITIVLCVLYGVWIFRYWQKRKLRQLRKKEYQKANIKADGTSDQDEEQRNPMLTDKNDLILQPCLGNQGISEIGETVSQLGGVPRLPESAAFNDFCMVLKDVQISQLRILQGINSLERPLVTRKCADSESHSDYASFGKTWNVSSVPDDLMFNIKSARSNSEIMECYHSSSGPHLSSDIKAKHNNLRTDEEMEISAFEWSDSNNIEMQSYHEKQRREEEDMKILEYNLKHEKTLGEGATSDHISRASTMAHIEDPIDYISVESNPIRSTLRTDDDIVTQADNSSDA